MKRSTETGTPRARVRTIGVRIVASTLVVLIVGVGLCVTSVDMRGVPAFEQRIRLSDRQGLEISVGPGCPLNLPELACTRVAHEFPRALRVVYWSGDAPTTLLSIPLPQR